MTHISGSWLGLGLVVVVALQYLICKCCIIVPSDNLLLSTGPIICWKCEFNNLKSSCSCSWGSSALGVLETSSYKNSDEEESILDINLCHVNVKHELPLAWIVAAASLTLGFCISLESSKTSASLSSLLPICSHSTFVTWQTIKVS